MNRFIRAALVLALGVLAPACDDGGTGPDDNANVTAGFSVAAGESVGSSMFASRSADAIVVSGTNGTLEISDVAFIVGELKLEGETAICGADDEGDLDEDDLDNDDLDDDDLDDDDCDEFETGLYFVDLPLTGGFTPIVAATVPAGTYTELKFETKDVDFDEAGEDDADDRIAALLADIAAAGYAEWPDDASLVVGGTFTPTGGEAQSFVAFFEGEIKIEMELDPPLVIDGESGTIDIEIDPAAWFVDLDGEVIDLSAFDYANTGEVLEFEAKLEHGFTKIELEGFDD